MARDDDHQARKLRQLAAVADAPPNLVASINGSTVVHADRLVRTAPESSWRISQEHEPRNAAFAHAVPCETADLRTVVADTLGALRPLLPPQLTIDARLEDAGPCRGRPIDTMQAVASLATYAATALGRSGERFSMSLRRDDDRTGARLQVTYPGMVPFGALADDRGGASSTGLSNAIAAVRRTDGKVAMERVGTNTIITVRWSPNPDAADEPMLHDTTILLVAGDAGPAGRLTEALEGAGAEVSLCLDARDAALSAQEALGLWDLAIVVGEVGPHDTDTVAAMLVEADPGMRVAISVPYAGANGAATIGHRDEPDTIVRTARDLMQGASCVS